jgi:hypothetical protein
LRLDRRYLFRHYWWIASLGLFCVILTVLLFATSNRASLILSAAASCLAFCYFVQQQKLAETKMLKELFTDFNERYDRLNETLIEVCDYSNVEPVRGYQCLLKCFQKRQTLIDKHYNAINDYFNLCSEEYYFYKAGYIPQDVWDCWEQGMKYFFSNKLVREIWDDEINKGLLLNSYYGFPKVVKKWS